MAGDEIQSLMQTAMSSLRQMVDVNTIVGDVIESSDGVTVVPVSRVSCGFVAGGGEYGSNNASDLPFAGGSGAGISLQPVGFLVMCKDQVRLISVCGAGTLERVIEAVPLVSEQLQNLFSKHCKNNDYMQTSKQETDNSTTM